MSNCATCHRQLTLQQARLHMWEEPEHVVEIDPEEAWADEQAWSERVLQEAMYQ